MGTDGANGVARAIMSCANLHRIEHQRKIWRIVRKESNTQIIIKLEAK